MGDAGAVLCLALPVLGMLALLYTLLYAQSEMGRHWRALHWRALRWWTGGPLRRWRYRRYLRSERWRLLRKQVLRRAGWQCETCGRRAPLDVHHLTYERFGDELLGDLRALCRECHDEAHRGRGRRRQPNGAGSNGE